MRIAAIETARQMTAGENHRFLGITVDGSAGGKRFVIRGVLRKTKVRHIGSMGYASAYGASSLSSMVAEFFGECGATNGYTQNGQCKSCSGQHDSPDFTSFSPSNHQRMLELLKKKAWGWRWIEGSSGQTKLRFNKNGGGFAVVGMSRDAALIIGTVLICSTKKQLDGFKMSFPNIFPA